MVFVFSLIIPRSLASRYCVPHYCSLVILFVSLSFFQQNGNGIGCAKGVQCQKSTQGKIVVGSIVVAIEPMTVVAVKLALCCLPLPYRFMFKSTDRTSCLSLKVRRSTSLDFLFGSGTRLQTKTRLCGNSRRETV